jgi:hypothetical protein
MAAPVKTTRGTPGGAKLTDGFRTLIAFAANPTVKFWEKRVTPPGLDGGDKIDISTMHNSTWRSFYASSLITMSDATVRVAYDPAVYSDILSLLNVPGSVTVWFPDSSYLNFFGFIRMFEPDEMSEGSQPEATLTLTCTNFDPVNKVEAAPVYGTA